MSETYHHINLSKQEQEKCMLSAVYSTIKQEYDNANCELWMVRVWLKTAPNPVKFAARMRVMDQAEEKELEARKKMLGLAKMILNEPKFDLDICELGWADGRWWCSFPQDDVLEEEEVEVEEDDRSDEQPGRTDRTVILKVYLPE